MVHKQDNDETRRADIAAMTAQLEVWSTKLDDLVTSAVGAGARPNDAYRVRIEDLQVRRARVQAKVDEFDRDSSTRDQWRAFRAEIKDDWAALEAGFEDLTR